MLVTVTNDTYAIPAGKSIVQKPLKRSPAGVNLHRTLDAPVVRVHQADVPMPYAKNLEKLAKPDAAKTIAAVKQVMYLE